MAPIQHIIGPTLTVKFPDSLKLAKIMLIYESGSKSIMINFRPISLLVNFLEGILDRCIKVPRIKVLKK